MSLGLDRRFPAAGNAWRRSAAWWSARSGREQMLLGILGALLLIWMGTNFVARPLLTARSEARNQIHTYQELTQRLRRSGPIGPIRASQRTGAPATILSTSAAELGLAPVVTADNGLYRVAIAGASYDALIRWMADVEKSSTLRFVTMRIERMPAAGIVSAELTVRS